MGSHLFHLEALVKNSSVKTIPLIVKNYVVPTENTFSSFLHNCPENTDGFHIEGPYVRDFLFEFLNPFSGNRIWPDFGINWPSLYFCSWNRHIAFLGSIRFPVGKFIGS